MTKEVKRDGQGRFLVGTAAGPGRPATFSWWKKLRSLFFKAETVESELLTDRLCSIMVDKLIVDRRLRKWIEDVIIFTRAHPYCCHLITTQTELIETLDQLTENESVKAALRWLEQLQAHSRKDSGSRTHETDL